MVTFTHQIPESWQWVNIKDVGKIQTGNTPPKKDLENYGNHIPLIKPPQLNDELISDAEDFLSTIGSKKGRILPPNSVLVSCIGNLGKTGINNKPVAFNQQINAITFFPQINPKYGFYFFQSQYSKRQLESLASATTISIVNKSKFSSIKIPLAPFNEQVRIVSKMEELFSRLDQGVKDLQQTQQHLEQYRQSILKQAFTGKLSASWRKINSEELDEYTTHPFNDNYWNLPSSWKWLPFKAIAEINPKLPYDLDYEIDVSFIPMSKVEKETGYIDLTENRKFGEVKKGYKRFINGDIIFAKITPCMENGKMAIPYGLTNGVGIGSTEFHVIRMRNDYSLNLFYYYFLLQKWFRKFAEQQFTGTVGHRRVPTDFMKTVYVPVTSYDEQRKIIDLIENHMSITNRIEIDMITSLNRCNYIKQSILKRAFNGGLVPQDPTDEPASVLLGKIWAEKVKK